MAFYSPDEAMGQRLAQLVRRLGDSAPAQAAGLSITWVRYSGSLLLDAGVSEPARGPSDRAVHRGEDGIRGRGASWQGSVARDPGELVQLPYLIAAERWLQRDLLEEEPELRRALEAMTRRGSHEATSYVLDRLSGTTSGPSLAPHQREAWMRQRQLVTDWLTSLGWPELEGCKAVQKTWQEGPYGRDRDWFGDAGENANRFSSDGLARLLEAVIAGRLISPPACRRMRALLSDQGQRSVSAAGPPAHAQSPQPWLAEAPLRGMRIWGKPTGGLLRAPLALYGERPGMPPVLLVVLAEQPSALDTVSAALVTELLGFQPGS